MIRLSRLTDYAFALLTQMVRESKSVWAASDLAERTGLPLPTVAKIMKRLTKSGIITARRGALGGYSLAKTAHTLSIAAIIEAIDGPIAITDCTEGGNHSCRVEPICPMSAGWNMVNRAIRQAMEGVSLADMARSLSSPKQGLSAPSLVPHEDSTLSEKQKVHL